MTRKLAFLALPLAVLSAVPLGAGHAPTVRQKATLERLASLAGNWAVADPAGDSTDLRGTYRVVAGGAAVIETLFEGMPEETVTIYHLDGNSVTVTQLSSRGVPARLTPASSKDRDVLRFATDAAGAKEGALVGMQVTLLDDEHARVEWDIADHKGGAVTKSFELMRSAVLEELSAEVGRMRVSLESLQAEIDRRMKRAVDVREKGEPTVALLETRTFPPGPGWNVSGVPMRIYMQNNTRPIATTFAGEGDEGMTVAHFPFTAGPGCRLSFGITGGPGFVAVVEETKAPPRRIRGIPEFATELDGGEYGPIVEKMLGGRWRDYSVAVDWDLARFEGKAMRLYVVDALTDHYGQVGISAVSIFEEARD